MYKDAEDVKAKVDILQLINHDTRLKKVARTGGGEWAGPCPFCGGNDRFRVQPFHPDGGRYYCRGCGDNYWHDVIDYVMNRDHIEFQEALSKLAPGEIITPIENEPITSKEIVRSQWVQASYEFLERCIDNLWGNEGKGARNYLYWRGLNDDSMKHWLLGYNPADSHGILEEWGISGDGKLFLPKGIVVPCHDAEGLHYLKIRRRTGKPKYLVLKGGKSWPFGLSTYLDTAYGYLFEGEFDVMLAYQTGFTGVGYASLPAGQPIRIDYQFFFNGIEDVIVALDSDPEGHKAAEDICKLPHFHKAAPYPIGNDLTEYYQHTGSLEKVFSYLYRQLDLLAAN
jgi:DNA primase